MPPTNNKTYETYTASDYDNGPVQVGYPGYSGTSTVGFLDALAAIDVPISLELNGGDNIGAKKETLTIDGKKYRSSAYDSYYMLAKNRPNLKVQTNAMVQKITLENVKGSTIATAVVFSEQETGNLVNVTAKKEVILCAGTFQTPQLLMLSVLCPLLE